MPQYPLFVGTRDVVFGNGFVAEVSTLGRALFDDSDGEFWLYGVNPGGLAGNGDCLSAANLDYQKGLTGVLFDLAADTSGFEEFKEVVRQFFQDTNAYREQEWLAAVKDVRDGSKDLSLEKTDASTTPTIVIENKTENFTAADNQLAEPLPALAAAA